MFVYAALLYEATVTCLTPVGAVDLLPLIRFNSRRRRRAFIVERLRFGFGFGEWFRSLYECSGRGGRRLRLKEL